MEQFSLEKIKEDIVRKIEAAIENPISEVRLGEIEEKIKSITEFFIENGFNNNEQKATEKALEEEILKSSTTVDNIAEFEIMLEILSDKFGSQHGWVENYLAHENAHGNVAEATGHDWVGYSTVFIKDNNNELTGIQPLNFTKSKPEWGPKEMLTKKIQVTEAPEKYGDKLSDGDKSELDWERQKLEKIEEDEKRLIELRKELGIK